MVKNWWFMWIMASILVIGLFGGFLTTTLRLDEIVTQT